MPLIPSEPQTTLTQALDHLSSGAKYTLVAVARKVAAATALIARRIASALAKPKPESKQTKKLNLVYQSRTRRFSLSYSSTPLGANRAVRKSIIES